MRAVIFDMDGVLVDSYEPHWRSWCELAVADGVSLTAEQFRSSFGQTSRDIIRRFWPAVDRRSTRVAEIDERKEALYRGIIAEDFPAMEGVEELLDALQRCGIAMAVGSSGPPENVDLVLERLGRQRFAAAVTGRDVSRGKPDPEVFLTAAHRLGADPRRCVVIEDAPAGIEAARAGGMAAVALLSTGRRSSDFDRVRPDLIVASLRDLSPGRLAALLR